MLYSDPEDGQMLNMVTIVWKYSICLMGMRQLFCFRVLDRLIVASFKVFHNLLVRRDVPWQGHWFPTLELHISTLQDKTFTYCLVSKGREPIT